MHVGIDLADVSARGVKSTSFTKIVISLISSGLLGVDSELSDVIIPLFRVTESLLLENIEGRFNITRGSLKFGSITISYL